MAMRVSLLLLLPAVAAIAQEGSTLTVTAIDSVTKLPVSGVSVTVPSAGKLREMTNDAGNVTFAGVPPGTHHIGTSRAGYNDKTTSLTVKSGDAATTLTLSIDALGEISGTVVDEDDAPLPGVMVYTGSNLQSTTDEEGRYQVRHLPPGNYIITLRLPFELRKKTLTVDAQSGESLGYAGTQYYPGGSDASLAQPIGLSVGSVLTGFKIRLRRTRLVTLHGRLVDAGRNEPLHPSALELVSGSSGGTFETGTVNEHGEFSFDLTPGHYSLIISGARSANDLPYSVPVDVGAAGAKDLEIRVPVFPKLNFIVKPSDPALELAGKIEISLAAFGNSNLVTRPVPSSVLDDIPPGDYRLSVRVGGVQAAIDSSRKIYLDSFRFGQQSGYGDIFDNPITVVEAGNPPIEITVTDQSGQISGSVVQDEPAESVFVMVSRAGSSSPLMSPHGLVRPDGSFTIAGLVPGDYELIAWIGGRFCTGSKCPCQDHAAKVKVVAGQSVGATLRACRY